MARQGMRNWAIGAGILLGLGWLSGARAGEECRRLPRVGAQAVVALVPVASAHGDKPRRNEMIDGETGNGLGSFWSTFQDTSSYPYDSHLPSSQYWFSLRQRFPYNFDFRFFGAARPVNCVQVWSRGNTFGAANVAVIPGAGGPEGRNEGWPGYRPFAGVEWGQSVANLSEGADFSAGRDDNALTSIVFPEQTASALRLQLGRSGERAPEIVFVNEAVFLDVRDGAWTGGGAPAPLDQAFGQDTGVKALTIRVQAAGGPLTIVVPDPSYPEQKAFRAAVEAPAGEIELTLDVADLVAPAGSRFAVQLEGGTLAGGSALTCPVAEALPEFQCQQVNMLQLWYSVQQVSTPRKAQHDFRRQNILKYEERHPLALAYGSLERDSGGPRYASADEFFAAPAGAPDWAVNGRAYARAARQFVDWWIDERQMADGQLGGHFNDDPEFTGRWFSGLGLMGDDKVRQGINRLTDGLWGCGRLQNGYIKDMYNIEHSNEETTLTTPIALQLNFGDPVYVEECLETFKNIEWWSEINARGHRHFRFERYSGLEMGTKVEHWYESAQSLLPGGFALWYVDNPRLRALLGEYVRTFAEHDGESQPGCIPIKDHDAAAFLAHMYVELTGDQAPLQASKVQRVRRQHDRSVAPGGGAMPATRQWVEALLATEYMHTRAQPLSDRIHRYNEKLEFWAQVSRAALGMCAPYKSETLSLCTAWEGMPPDDFASHVTGGSDRELTAEVYNFSEQPLNGRLRVFNLAHGTYEIAAPGAPAQAELRRGDVIPFTAAPRAVTAIAIRQTAALPDVRGLADLGAGHLDAAAAEGRLRVRIHNVGARAAENFKVVVRDAGGATLGEQAIARLEWPEDLLARTVDLEFPWSGRPGDQVEVIIDPDDAIPEITEQNNRVRIAVAEGALPPPVGADWRWPPNYPPSPPRGLGQATPGPQPSPGPGPGPRPTASPGPRPATPVAFGGSWTWKMYVRANRAGGRVTNLTLPRSSSSPLVSSPAIAGVGEAFRDNKKYTGDDLREVLGEPGLAVLSEAAAAYIRANPALCRDFESVAEVRWALCVARAGGAAPPPPPPPPGPTPSPRQVNPDEIPPANLPPLQPAADADPDRAALLAAGAARPAAGIPPVVHPPAGEPYPLPPQDELTGGFWACPPAAAPPPPAPAGLNLPGPVPGEAGDEPYEGFGANAGGRGGQVLNVPADAGRISAACGGSNVMVSVTGGGHTNGAVAINGRNVTLDGGGLTLWHGVEVRGQNLVIRNLRVRNGGDNFSVKTPTRRILFSHVSVTGSTDDGLSLAYGTKLVTVQYCFLGANTRSVFIKYDGADFMSLHHNWLLKQWIRGPLVHEAYVDARNNVQEDWWMWGGPRFETGACGNAVNNAYVLHGFSPGKVDATAYLYRNGDGRVFISGSLALGFVPVPQRGNAPAELPAPAVTTHSAPEALALVRERAGCLPRDEVDQAIISLERWFIGDERPLRIFELEGGAPAARPAQQPAEGFVPGPKVPPVPSGEGWKNRAYRPPVLAEGATPLPGALLPGQQLATPTPAGTAEPE